MICMVESDTITVDETDSYVGMKGRDTGQVEDIHPSSVWSCLSGVAWVSAQYLDHWHPRTWHRPESTCDAPLPSSGWIREVRP